METNPENPKGWTLPSELPPAFALPQQFRQSLPAEIQQWLASVEKRIDGMTLDRIRQEAYNLYDNDSPDTENSLDENGIYRIGRRLFYTRCQQIAELAYPGQGLEIGVDLPWEETVNTLPGGAVTQAMCDSDERESIRRIGLKEAGLRS